MPVVLILAPVDDIHAKCVAHSIRHRHGIDVEILDAAGYPSSWQLSVCVGRNKESFSIATDAKVIVSEQVRGIWYRRLNRHSIPARVSDLRVREFCLGESKASFDGWLHGLGSLVMNAPAAEQIANRKTVQLQAARLAGLSIPNTLITNSPDEVRAFVNSIGQPLIIKTLTGASWRFTETRQLDGDYLASLDTLQLGPAIFQEMIPGTDVRATVIDDEVFAATALSKHSGATLDWRLDQAVEFQTIRLPSDVVDRIIVLMRHLGLRYGAIDLRVSPEGQYVFLEVNPGGQFLFIEAHTGQPICDALADRLVSCSQTADAKDGGHTGNGNHHPHSGNIYESTSELGPTTSL